ncbi:Molybdopterin-guanine dinucleotide biosynthesis protein A [Sulfitobacter donghicola DSW-25 = KCTC 12864 = JCM 14565]|uniref:Molybdopterin-guanine dinucleotide biosynthesis protein A n=1 Tax=Sulfitobacter donghicola DSW-25 = KCTC 12864 = JCM 14565 TaxID=1300350 RepID=A0A073IE62_9RHOB|nr:Molybdopterin-guanine dinucleotide biosynthesis protein A [Sulfitobacter donghicola DSW-25 = KCTC 12864 = JCM 14565]
MPVGVVLRRTPGVTRWASFAWTASGILIGAGDANWRELRREGDAVEFHAATLTLELHGAETEAYLHGLSTQVPSVYVIMRKSENAETPLEVLLVTASPYEAQDYTDSGEELVEKVPMPAGLIAWVRDFVEAFHQEEVFVKRKRDRKRIDQKEDGIGDGRIAQLGDVYRSPSSARKERLQ